MPIAKLNRGTLQLLASDRIEEARILVESGRWTGAYYLVGLGIECALKACLAGAVKEHDFPDKEFVNKMYVHNLEALFQLSGAMWDEFQKDVRGNIQLKANWETVKDWKDSRRYEVVEELEAKALYDAAAEQQSGIMAWIRSRW